MDFCVNLAIVDLIPVLQASDLNVVCSLKSFVLEKCFQKVYKITMGETDSSDILQKICLFFLSWHAVNNVAVRYGLTFLAFIILNFY